MSGPMIATIVLVMFMGVGTYVFARYFSKR